MQGSGIWAKLSLHFSDREFHRLQMQQHKILHTSYRCISVLRDLIDECFYSFSSVWTKRPCVYVVWWPLDAFLFCLVDFYLCLLSLQSQRNSNKKKVSLTKLQTETMFIQLLSCPARGTGRTGIWTHWPASKTGLRKVFSQFVPWWDRDVETADPNPAL